MNSGSGLVSRISVLFVLLIFWISFNGHLNARGQQENDQTTTESTRNVRPVNVFLITDDLNSVVLKSMENSLKTMKDEYPGYLGKVVKARTLRNNPMKSLEMICKKWKNSLTEETSEILDLVLDATTTDLGARTVSTFTAALGIPTLSAQFGQAGDLRYWRNLTADQEGYLIQVMPPADVIPWAIRQLAIDNGISNVAVIFEAEFTMERKYKSLLQNVSTRHVMVQAKDSDNKIRMQLKQLRNLDFVNYFVLSGDNVLELMLDSAHKNNYFGHKYSWYAFSQNDVEPSCKCKNLSLLFFKPKISVATHQRLGDLLYRRLLFEPALTSAFYYDLVRLGIFAMRRAIGDSDWPDKPEHMFCDDYNGSNTPTRDFDFVKALKAASSDKTFEAILSGFAWRQKNGLNHASFEMSVNMIKIAEGNPTSTEELGSWTSGLDTEIKVSNGAKAVIANHKAVRWYRIVTVVKPPFVMYDPETNKWSGYCIDMIDYISSIINFEYEIHEVSSKKYGSLNENGLWDGMIKELKIKKADIALGALTVMADRETVVDFTIPFYKPVGFSILMQKIKPETALFKFLDIFDDNVWYGILVSYIFTSFLMWFFDRWSPYSYQNNREKYKEDDEKRVFNLKECFWFCMTSLTPQGGGEAPKNLSGRMTVIGWWIFGFIVISTYIANLSACLTISRTEGHIESLEELTNQFTIKHAPICNSEAYTYFKRMSDINERFNQIWMNMAMNTSLTDEERAKFAVWNLPLSNRHREIFDDIKETTCPVDLKVALKRVRRLDSDFPYEFALVDDASDIRYVTMTSCDLMAVGEELAKKPYAIAVQKGSPLRDEFNDVILKMLNEKLLDTLEMKWWDRNPNRVKCEKVADLRDGISMENIGGVFIIVFVGIILSSITLTLEYYWYRFRPEHSSPNSIEDSEPVPIRNAKPIRISVHPFRSKLHRREITEID